jgi:hypothetical protein
VHTDQSAMTSTINHDSKVSGLDHTACSSDDHAAKANHPPATEDKGGGDVVASPNKIQAAASSEEETVAPSDKPAVEKPASKPSKSSHCSREEIPIPAKEDILMGRGPPYQSHPGNQAMRKLIEENRAAYSALPREKKSWMVKQILRQLFKGGARFLKRREGYISNKSLCGGWEVAARGDAYEKVCHALRSKYRPKSDKETDQLANTRPANAAAFASGGMAPGGAGNMFNPGLMNPAMMAAFSQQAGLMNPFQFFGRGGAFPWIIPVPVPMVFPAGVGLETPYSQAAMQQNMARLQNQQTTNLAQAGAGFPNGIPGPSPDHQVSSHDFAVADEAPSSASIAEQNSRDNNDSSLLMSLGDFLEENRNV